MSFKLAPLSFKYVGLAAAFTFLTSAVYAAEIIPNEPLQSSSSVAPNILFILDDSGSMASTFMPAPEATDDVAPTTNTPNIGGQTYARNGIYYNPAITYKPWRTGVTIDGVPQEMTDTPYDNVYTNALLASGTTGSLATAVRSYYVPKDLTKDTLSAANTAYFRDPANYWRYQILLDGRVMRSELLANSNPTSIITTALNLGTTGPVNNSSLSAAYSFNLPADVTSMTISSSGGTGTSADLYIRQGAVPTLAAFDFRNRSPGNAESRIITSPGAGTWFVRLHANGGNFNGVNVNVSYVTAPSGTDANGCDLTTISGTGWRNCTQTTPTGRSEPAERANFATWFSFHRTRSKTAKAGASLAFSQQPEKLRIGFGTIHNISNTAIPVNNEDGWFRNANKSAWYTALHTSVTPAPLPGLGDAFTPLRLALQKAGNYFSRPNADGPYGPEAGSNQLSCRQNFAILTTDGFWNTPDENETVTAGNTDGSAGTPITGPGASYTYTPVRPYSDNYNTTLADVAMRYWKQDLRTDLVNNVPTTTQNNAFWQHMSTFGISIGLKGSLDPVLDLPRLTAGTPNINGTTGWPNPLTNTGQARIDDLLHASVNGRGEFISAQNAQAFADGVSRTLGAINAAQSSGSNIAANSIRVVAGTAAYESNYFSGSWKGELNAYPVTNAGLGTTKLWTASSLIPAPASRDIFTREGTLGVGGTNGGSTFPSPSQSAVLPAGVANYLRGVRTGEGTIYRKREHVLGDIINSSPVYVADTNTVYVSANDGMMHAFNAATGVEDFAYVPNLLSMTNLASLSSLTYSHRFFVDGQIVVSSRVQTPNENYLVGALGRGGKGLFGLDVTRPAAFVAGDVKWESVADDDMGYVIGRPVIVKIDGNVDAVMVGNGINSTSGKAALFFYNLKTGQLIKKIVVGTSTNNALSSPTGYDADDDGDIDYAYAGDIEGNVWKFDLNDDESDTSKKDSSTLLFTAVDSDGNAQAITGGIAVGLDSNFDVWLSFGTGRYLTAGDIQTPVAPDKWKTDTWYGIKDEVVEDRSELKQRKITFSGLVDQTEVRAFETAQPGDMIGFKGWYMDLLLPPHPPGTGFGERMTGTPFYFSANVLIASSFITVGDGCSLGGSGYLNAINPFTGGTLTSVFFDANGDGSINTSDLAAGGIIPSSFNPNVGIATDAIALSGGSTSVFLVNGTAGPGDGGGPGGLVTGRVSWREILGD
jgi:type IV pilus assembly protein PilY1